MHITDSTNPAIYFQMDFIATFNPDSPQLEVKQLNLDANSDISNEDNNFQVCACDLH